MSHLADIPVSEFGARLKQARQARGVSLVHIANVTKISVRALEAVERNDFSRLPGGIYTRAFVRAYACEVGLDPNVALKAFLEQCPEDAAAVPNSTPESIDGTSRAGWQERLSWRHAAVALAVLALLAIGGYMLARRSSRPVSSTGAPALPVASTVRLPTRVATAPALIPASRQAVTPPTAPQATKRLTMAPVVKAARPTAPLTLGLAATSSCWISTTADGGPAASKLYAAGERTEVTASREIVLKVGDAAALSLTINGSPARPLGTRGQVVTVRIGTDNRQSFIAPR